MVSGAYPEQHYDLVVRPAAGPCGCGAGPPPPPPPRFAVPPPPADPAWAAAGEDLCDLLAPLQVCRARSGLTAVPDPQSTPSQSMLAALITTSLFLFIVLVAGTIFFCKHRRKLASLMVTSAADKRDEVSRALYDDLSRRPHHGAPTGLRSTGPHIEAVRLRPSQTYSDSDEDCHQPPSGDPEPEPEPGGVSGGRPEPRYVCSVPPAATGSRRRSARPRHHPALRRKDPYYYSDILERHETGRVEGDDDVAAVAYGAPRDERRPLACRLAPDPLPDLYGGRPGASRAPGNKLSSFRPAGSTDRTGADSEVYVNSSGRLRASYGGSGRNRRTHDT
ncbi:hypothetical protein FJT64_022881 [Amphibalanus amphitrite]|uniref:Uncharacterized protein n=1 Tax=Amphibalanus amphitrite TaxID=1232801 RepID=A0A6A4WP45_AMPAM|nr:hypothetical protein FJT64_022881 [Amphibalanus amphitrite]